MPTPPAPVHQLISEQQLKAAGHEGQPVQPQPKQQPAESSCKSIHGSECDAPASSVAFGKSFGLCASYSTPKCASEPDAAVSIGDAAGRVGCKRQRKAHGFCAAFGQSGNTHGGCGEKPKEPEVLQRRHEGSAMSLLQAAAEPPPPLQEHAEPSHEPSLPNVASEQDERQQLLRQQRARRDRQRQQLQEQYKRQGHVPQEQRLEDPEVLQELLQEMQHQPAKPPPQQQPVQQQQSNIYHQHQQTAVEKQLKLQQMQELERQRNANQQVLPSQPSPPTRPPPEAFHAPAGLDPSTGTVQTHAFPRHHMQMPGPPPLPLDLACAGVAVDSGHHWSSERPSSSTAAAFPHGATTANVTPKAYGCSESGDVSSVHSGRGQTGNSFGEEVFAKGRDPRMQDRGTPTRRGRSIHPDRQGVDSPQSKHQRMSAKRLCVKFAADGHPANRLHFSGLPSSLDRFALANLLRSVGCAVKDVRFVSQSSYMAQAALVQFLSPGDAELAINEFDGRETHNLQACAAGLIVDQRLDGHDVRPGEEYGYGNFTSDDRSPAGFRRSPTRRRRSLTRGRRSPTRGRRSRTRGRRSPTQNRKDFEARELLASTGVELDCKAMQRYLDAPPAVQRRVVDDIGSRQPGRLKNPSAFVCARVSAIESELGREQWNHAEQARKFVGDPSSQPPAMGRDQAGGWAVEHGTWQSAAEEQQQGHGYAAAPPVWPASSSHQPEYRHSEGTWTRAPAFCASYRRPEHHRAQGCAAAADQTLPTQPETSWQGEWDADAQKAYVDLAMSVCKSKARPPAPPPALQNSECPQPVAEVDLAAPPTVPSPPQSLAPESAAVGEAAPAKQSKKATRPRRQRPHSVEPELQPASAGSEAGPSEGAAQQAMPAGQKSPEAVSPQVAQPSEGPHSGKSAPAGQTVASVPASANSQEMPPTEPPAAGSKPSPFEVVDMQTLMQTLEAKAAQASEKLLAKTAKADMDPQARLEAENRLLAAVVRPFFPDSPAMVEALVSRRSAKQRERQQQTSSEKVGASSPSSASCKSGH